MTVYLSGTGLWHPPHAVSNEDLCNSYNAYVAAHPERGLAPSSPEFIAKASGIHSRYMVDKVGALNPKRMAPHFTPRSEDALSLQAEASLAAAHEALDQADVLPSEVDLIIVAASNMERPYPAVSIEVQHHLGAKGFAYDMNVACSSATFAMQAGMSALESGMASVVLIVNPEICSGHLDFTDRESHFIFGDVATAIVLTKKPQGSLPYAIDSMSLKTSYSNNIRNNFGFLSRAYSEDSITVPVSLFKQNGRKVFREVTPMVAEHILGHLHSRNITPNDLKVLWLHQANLHMNTLISEKILGRTPSPEEAPIILDRFANTASAGSIIAFHTTKHTCPKGDWGLISSFGAGYSVGSVLVKREA